MKKPNCPCAFPSASEEELATVPGPHPGTAFRVSVETSAEGYVRIEQLAYSADLGWYTQKSFCVPREVLTQLLPTLRKADCLMPRPATAAADQPDSFVFPGLRAPSHTPHGPERREA